MTLLATTTSLREAYGLCLVELGKRDPNMVVLEADLGKSTRSVLFQEAFPARFFEMGIAEQNMASTSAGLALTGKTPFYSTFAVFAVGRAYDQIRNSICIPGLKVRICGSSAGLSDFGDGKTHQSVEDVAAMRVLPNMTVLVPADAIETAKMMAVMDTVPGPVYLRINRNDLPLITPPGSPYRIGEITTVCSGQDAVVFASGVMVSKAIEAAEMLAREGVDLKVLNVSTIKPLDRGAVIAHAKNMKGIVTAEEHSIIGGLGSAIAEALRMERHAPIEFVGIQDVFGISAKTYGELLDVYGLTTAAVVSAVRATLSS